MGLRLQHNQRVRSDIFSAALQLAQRHGFAQVSMEEVARRAGVARRTLYRHFEDKSDLLFPFARDRVGALVQGMARARKAHVDWSFTQVFESALQAAAMRTLEPELEAASEVLVDETPELAARRAALFELLRGPIFQELKRNADTRAHKPFALHVLTGAVLGALQAAVRHWPKAGGGRPSEAAAEVVRLLAPLFSLPHPPRKATRPQRRSA